MQLDTHHLTASLAVVLALTAGCSDGPTTDPSVPPFPCDIAGADAVAADASIDGGTPHRAADRSNGRVHGVYPHRIAQWTYFEFSGRSYDVYGEEIALGVGAQTTCRYSSHPPTLPRGDLSTGP